MARSDRLPHNGYSVTSISSKLLMFVISSNSSEYEMIKKKEYASWGAARSVADITKYFEDS